MLALRPTALLLAATAAVPVVAAMPAATGASSESSPAIGDPLAPDHHSEPLVIEAERVIVRPGHELEDVKVLIQEGRILAVGKDVTAPQGAKVVKAPVVCASFVDSWSTVGIDTGALNEFSSSPDTRTADAWNPYDASEARSEALRAGVTAARVQAAPSAPVGGVGAFVRLDPSESDPVLLEDAGIGASIGVTRGGRVLDIFDRVGEVDRLIGLLGRAKGYDEEWRKYEADLLEWEADIAEKTAELEEDFKKAKKKRDKEVEEAKEKGKDFKEERYKEDKQPRKPKLDVDMETLARAVNGEMPLVVEVHRAEEIRALLQKTAGFTRLRLVIAGGTEADVIASELAERDVAVICWPGPKGQGGPDEWARHDLSLAGSLEKAGVQVLIGSGGNRSPRELRMLASLAVGHGLSREAALEAITSAPAAAFDLRDQIGSVERGKNAELVLLSGDPLDTTSRVVGVVTGGRLVQ